MTRRDPLAILRLLRRTEVEAARRQTAEAYDRLRQVQAAHSASVERMAHEKALSTAIDYANWTPAAHARQHALARQMNEDAKGAAEAQQALIAASLAEQVIIDEQRQQSIEARRQRLAREQRLLDEV